MKILIPFCGCVLAGVLAGCGKPAPPSNTAGAIATVDGKPITAADLASELARSNGSQLPGPEAALEDLVQRERLVARARRLGLENDPVVQRSVQSALIARLKQIELEPRLDAVVVSDSDLSPVRQAHRVSQVRLAILRQELSPKASVAKVRAAEERLAEAREKALRLPALTVGFGALALDYSDDEGSRMRGGDLGWLKNDPAHYNLDSAVLAAGFALPQPGDITPIIRGQDGLYLVRVIDRRSTGPAAQVENLELLRHRALREKRQAVEQAFAEEIRRLIPVSVDTGALAEFTRRSEAADLPALNAIPEGAATQAQR